MLLADLARVLQGERTRCRVRERVC